MVLKVIFDSLLVANDSDAEERLYQAELDEAAPEDEIVALRAELAVAIDALAGIVGEAEQGVRDATGTNPLREAVRPPLELIYRATEHGWSGKEFHDSCNHRGPTLTVIQDTKGFIFGAFTDTSWTSEAGFRAASLYREKEGEEWCSPGAFLFSLRSFARAPPTKMSLQPLRHDSAVYHHENRGPCFGTHDVRVFSNANSKHAKNRSSIGDTYDLPDPPGRAFWPDKTTFLTGSEYFTAAEVEVFGFQTTDYYDPTAPDEELEPEPEPEPAEEGATEGAGGEEQAEEAGGGEVLQEEEGGAE